jgi:ferritin-like metal-binding protein YciE
VTKMKVNSIERLFEENIKDLYDAEKQMVRALPKLVKAATSRELTRAFQEHLEVTKKQVGRLEKVFEFISVKPKSKTCEGMKGLVAEGQEAIEQEGEDMFRDVMLIGAAKRVEHYEMAGYQAAILIANAMANDDAANLLRQTLTEEEEADGALAKLGQQILEFYSSGVDQKDESDGEPRARGAGRASAARGR